MVRQGIFCKASVGLSTYIYAYAYLFLQTAKMTKVRIHTHVVSLKVIGLQSKNHGQLLYPLSYASFNVLACPRPGNINKLGLNECRSGVLFTQQNSQLGHIIFSGNSEVWENWQERSKMPFKGHAHAKFCLSRTSRMLLSAVAKFEPSTLGVGEDNSALLIPVQFEDRDGRKEFFTSFLSRDDAAKVITSCWSQRWDATSPMLLGSQPCIWGCFRLAFRISGPLSAFLHISSHFSPRLATHPWP